MISGCYDYGPQWQISIALLQWRLDQRLWNLLNLHLDETLWKLTAMSMPPVIIPAEIQAIIPAMHANLISRLHRLKAIMTYMIT